METSVISFFQVVLLLASLSQRQLHRSLFCQIVGHQQQKTKRVHSVIHSLGRLLFPGSGECWNVGQTVHDICRQYLAIKAVGQWQKALLPLWWN